MCIQIDIKKNEFDEKNLEEFQNELIALTENYMQEINKLQAKFTEYDYEDIVQEVQNEYLCVKKQ